MRIRFTLFFPLLLSSDPDCVNCLPFGELGDVESFLLPAPLITILSYLEILEAGQNRALVLYLRRPTHSFTFSLCLAAGKITEKKYTFN